MRGLLHLCWSQEKHQKKKQNGQITGRDLSPDDWPFVESGAQWENTCFLSAEFLVCGAEGKESPSTRGRPQILEGG